MCALPANAPTFTIDTDNGTVTIEGSLSWTEATDNGPVQRGTTSFSIVMPLTDSIFDPDFEAPVFESDNAFIVGNTSVQIGDPKYYDQDGQSPVEYAIFGDPDGGPDYPPVYGMLFAPFGETYAVGSLDGDQTYNIIIATNEDFTEITEIRTQSYYREPVRFTDYFVEFNYYGFDQFEGSILVSDITGTVAPPPAANTPTEGDDTLDFSDATEAVEVDGLGGADVITGGAAADTLRGGDGWDTIRGGGDRDVLIGDAGRDLLYGGDDRDELRGSTGNDTLIGNDGNDTLLGAKGADRLLGGRGNDLLSGGNADDFLRGGKGWDTLNDGGGTDTLWGDTGRDTFKLVFDDRQDVIEDFEDGWDTIDLSLWGEGLSRSDLSFQNSAEGVVIGYETESLLVKGSSGTLLQSDLGADDFFFG